MTRFLLIAALVAGISSAPGACAAGAEELRLDRYGDPLPKGAIARLGTLRMRGCRGPVVFSPDGKYVVAAGGEGSAQAIFWDIDTGRRVKVLTANGNIVKLAFSPDGKQLAAVNGGHANNQVWDVATGKHRFAFTGGTVDFSADGKTLLAIYPSGEKAIVRSYDTTEGKQLDEWSLAHQRPGGSSLSSDGQLAAVPSAINYVPGVGDKPTVSVFDLRKKVERKQLPVDVGRVAENCRFSRDGRRLVADGTTGWVVWDWKSGKVLRTWKGRVHNVAAFSPDGRRLAWIGADEDGPGVVSLWVVDLDGGEPRSLGVTDVIGWRHPAAFSNDGKKLAVVTQGNAVTVIDSRTGRDLLPLDAHTGPVRGVAYFSDGRYLLTRDPFHMLVWEATTGKLLRRYPDDLPAGEKVLLNTANHGRFLTAELPSGVLRLRDLVRGKELRRLKGKDGYVSAAPWDISEVSADGTLAAILGPGGVRVYDLETGDIRCQFDPKHAVWGMHFSPDKRTLVLTIQDYEKGLLTSYRDTRSGDKTEAPANPTPWKDAQGRWSESLPAIRARLRKLKLYLGQLPAGAEIPDVIGNAYESPDGRYLAVQGQARPLSSTDAEIFVKDKSYVRLWDIVTHRLIVELDAKRYTHQIVGFTPDSRMLLTYTSFPTTIHLWECATGRERLQLLGHKNGDVRVAFRPDGRSLASGGTDTQVLLWDVTSRMPDGVWRQTRHTPEQLAELWKTLADSDAASAYQAMWFLEAAPEQTLKLLQEQLHSIIAPDPKRLARLLNDLDSEEFTVREKATGALERLGELAAPALRRVLQEQPTLERRRRCERLLEKLSAPSGESLRGVRAVEVLERLGTAEARALLEKLRQGDPSARLTQEARVALKRLAVK